MGSSFQKGKMKVIILLLFTLSLSAQNSRINTVSTAGFPMVTIYPQTPLNFILDDGDTVTVNILKDSISMCMGQYAVYVYFYKYQYGRMYNITLVMDDGSGITLKPSYMDTIETYYEYEVDMATLSYLSTGCVMGLLFEADGFTISCLMTNGTNHFKDFLNKN